MHVASREARFRDLAPTCLETRRKKRYHGDDQAVLMEELEACDRRIILRLYGFLCQLMDLFRAESSERMVLLGGLVHRADFENLIGEAGRLGADSYAARPDTKLAEAMHDVRGGGLSAILGLLQLWMLRRDDRMIGETLYFLARDHLKIMRNALKGLDDEKRNQDLELKLHSTDLIVEKWQKMRLRAGGEDLLLEASCPRSLPIAECCVEFGAIDRILYNLLNNAARHSADKRVRLTLLPIPDESGPNLRFIVENRLRPEDAKRLAQLDLRTLFDAGVSTTGSGFGLAVVAEFVAHAYGFAEPSAAIEGKYVGAEIIGDFFAIWFHWPIVAED